MSDQRIQKWKEVAKLHPVFDVLDEMFPREKRMKLWAVQWDEPDGAPTKEPGKSSQAFKRMSHVYAAVTPREVWEALQHILSDPEKEFVSLSLASPSVTILKRDGSPVSESHE